jgi:hypothetical protein
MSTAHKEIPIDPALQAESSNHARSASAKLAGSKRKARNLLPVLVAPSSRVTRRSAAATAGRENGLEALPMRSTGLDTVAGEPARGEEENLIEYPWERGTVSTAT